MLGSAIDEPFAARRWTVILVGSRLERCDAHPVSERFLIDQIRTMDTQHIDGEAVACLERDEMAEIEYALARYLGLGL